MNTQTLAQNLTALSASPAAIEAAVQIDSAAPRLLAARAAGDNILSSEIHLEIRAAYRVIADSTAEARAAADAWMDAFDEANPVDEETDHYRSETTPVTEAVDPAVTALIEEIEATAAEARDASDADSAAEAILTAGPLLEEAWPAEYGTDAYDDIDTAAEALRDALERAWEVWADTHVQERTEVIEVDGHEVEVTWKPIDITANSSRPDDTFEGRVYAFDYNPVGITDPGWDQVRIILETEDGEEVRLWGRGSEEYDGGRIASSYHEEDEDAALAPGGYHVTLL